MKARAAHITQLIPAFNINYIAANKLITIIYHADIIHQISLRGEMCYYYGTQTANRTPKPGREDSCKECAHICWS